MDIKLLETELCMFQNKVAMLWWDDASIRKKDCNSSKFYSNLDGIYNLISQTEKHPCLGAQTGGQITQYNLKNPTSIKT